MIYLILIFAIHFLADFVCQTHQMAMNKSKSIWWLSYHVLVYSSVTTVLWTIFFGNMIGSLFIIPAIFGVTFGTHWITDYYTSKWTSRLWEEKKVHEFFLVIGLDQLIHATTLLITYNYLINTL